MYADRDRAEELVAQNFVARKPARVHAPKLVRLHREFHFALHSRNLESGDSQVSQNLRNDKPIGKAAANIGVRDGEVSLGHPGQSSGKVAPV